MTIEEILILPDIQQKIQLLKEARKTPLPNRDTLMADWDPMLHDVMDKVKRPDAIKVIQEEKRGPDGRVIQMEITAPDPVNRIPIPLEQDITNIHTAFTVGTEPKLTCETDNDTEKELFAVVKQIDRKNKTKYHNKKVVRSWLSETEVAEYWYTVEDKGFWRLIFNRIKKAIGKEATPDRKFKCAIWSPFRGDKLYPFFDETGDYKALSREYMVKKSATLMETYFMTITDTDVYTWKQSTGAGWEVVDKSTFNHKFPKNPTIYTWRPYALCRNIKPIRERIETLNSNYADCIDYNFAPKLIAEGRISGIRNKDSRGGIVETEKGGKLYYLSWQQTPEAAKLEYDNLTEQAYAQTNTPRISFENLKGAGSALSGVAFKYAFMGAHMAVSNHAEVIGEFLQRRYNFLVSAIGSVNKKYEQVSQDIDIDVEIVPYMIGSLADDIKNAVDATAGGKVASMRTGIVLAGLVEGDKVDEEIEAIEAEQAKEAEESAFPRANDVA